MSETIWTIGHSTRAIEEFIAALRANGIKLVTDVRLLPGSKRFPQFNQEQLALSLSASGIAYQHFPELGGRRKARPDSLNIAWRNLSFRGYADHMETAEFHEAIERLHTAAAVGSTAVMCAEAVWWRCHRALISDHLKVRGTEVLHIIDAKKTETHPFTSAATVINGRLSYASRRELKF